MTTLTSDKGVTVNTPLSNEEAIALLPQVGSKFAAELFDKANKYSLSNNQLVWAHKLVLEKGLVPGIAKAEPVSEQLENFASIKALFDHAKVHLQYPKIKFTINGVTIQLSLAGNKSKYAGHLQVTDGGKFGSNKWYGRIDMAGIFHASNNCPANVLEFLKQFAADPVNVAATYGKATGNCCFCKIGLSDPRSLAVGYGPICAGNFGLPWGEQVLSLTACLIT